MKVFIDAESALEAAYFTTGTENRASSAKTAFPLQCCMGVPSQPSEEIRRAKINFAFENLEGQGEVSSDVSAFK